MSDATQKGYTSALVGDSYDAVVRAQGPPGPRNRKAKDAGDGYKEALLYLIQDAFIERFTDAPIRFDLHQVLSFDAGVTVEYPKTNWRRVLIPFAKLGEQEKRYRQKKYSFLTQETFTKGINIEDHRS